MYLSELNLTFSLLNPHLSLKLCGGPYSKSSKEPDQSWLSTLSVSPDWSRKPNDSWLFGQMNCLFISIEKKMQSVLPSMTRMAH